VTVPADVVLGTVTRRSRLDLALVDVFPDLSRSAAARLVREGRVRVDGTVAERPSLVVEPGAALVLERPPPRPPSVAAEALPLRIMLEDEDLAVIDKAAGMVVHPAPGHAGGTLVNALLHHLDGLSGVGGEERPGVVHRLDRGTSGLLVVAKHDSAHRALAAQFATHTAGRTYLALVHGSPAVAAGTIESHLGRHPTDRVRQATVRSGGRRAVTHWTRLGTAGTVSLLACTLETGRTHQVRVHLSEQGWPVLGDTMYARRGHKPPATLRDLVDDTGSRPLLHAWILAFDHPRTSERTVLTAAPPPDFTAVLDALGLPVPDYSAHVAKMSTPGA
jgi:23S rRNA pseudouridine1911/1915/1917 synthase